ncbi:hypothetical protein AALO_G00047440, partial [Alosa alosa]
MSGQLHHHQIKSISVGRICRNHDVGSGVAGLRPLQDTVILRVHWTCNCSVPKAYNRPMLSLSMICRVRASS